MFLILVKFTILKMNNKLWKLKKKEDRIESDVCWIICFDVLHSYGKWKKNWDGKLKIKNCF